MPLTAQTYKNEFIRFCLQHKVLQFGKFTLKSGRISPYFFNAGLFNSGVLLQKLGDFYSAAIMEAKLDFDVLFGPAYKGIPLATATAISLARNHHLNKAICFNRKEIKNHGEGGNLIGATIDKKNILLIDDVITAGTAIREIIKITQPHNAILKGIILALDRQEKGQDTALSAITQIEQEFNIRIVSIIAMTDLIDYAESNPEIQIWSQAIKDYREQYCITS